MCRIHAHCLVIELYEIYAISWNVLQNKQQAASALFTKEYYKHNSTVKVINIGYMYLDSHDTDNQWLELWWKKAKNGQ